MPRTIIELAKALNCKTGGGLTDYGLDLFIAKQETLLLQNPKSRRAKIWLKAARLAKSLRSLNKEKAHV